MTNLQLRSITGAVYVTLVVSGILWLNWLLVLLMGFFAMFGVFEFLRMTRADLNASRIVSGLATVSLLFSGLILFDWVQAPALTLPLVLLASIIISFVLLFLPGRNAWLAFMGAIGFLYVLIPLIMLLSISSGSPGDMESNRLILLGFFILLWVNDTAAYLVGRRFGRTALAHKISPAKTWEGFAGGLLASVILGILMASFTEPGIGEWILISLLTVGAGTLGDLLESSIKRRSGVKDSGTILPGHGGVLDRIDSLLLALPFVFSALVFIFAR